MDLATAYEIFNSVAAYQELAMTNWRWTAQVARKINKKQSVALGYLIQRDLTESPQHLDFVFLLSYKVEL
jgi:predicted component of type VI protein secretion system